ncbi:hypothetical protein [Streptomyces sp. NPDC018045]|uniref:hypothetical protein n=1 Tax=Streptomyces sp. NPDC018045 TaxID=3365037 RepID=UPI0037AABC6E
MTKTEAARIRGLVANAHEIWVAWSPTTLVATAMRSLLWDIDHPAPEDQTPEVYCQWLDTVEPRWPEGDFIHPREVARLKAACWEFHGEGRVPEEEETGESASE